MMTTKITKNYICAGIGKSLREFGYPDATDDKMAEIYDAYKAGKRGDELPHQVIGRFAERQLEEAEALLKELP